MYLFPSSSYKYAPFASLIKTGSPPTDLNALTGELTPPGITLLASVKSFLERSFNKFNILITQILIQLYLHNKLSKFRIS